MAFTSQEKANVRYYLGFQDQFRDVNTTLESQLAGGTSAEGETIARALLTSLAAADTSLAASHGRLKAIKVGPIELSAETEIRMLRAEGRRFVGRLASLFGVDPRADVFGEGAGSSSMGGLVPLG